MDSYRVIFNSLQKNVGLYITYKPQLNRTRRVHFTWLTKILAKKYNFKYVWSNENGVFLKKMNDGSSKSLQNIFMKFDGLNKEK